jgi:hypothetical protein
MEDEFIIEQAKQFAKITERGASKFDKLSVLKERLEQELAPYERNNKLKFLKYWKEELDNLFSKHLQSCLNLSECPQHKTSRNANFLFYQHQSANHKMPDNVNLTEYSDAHDLNYYFNASYIPNQDLVFETYNFFKKGMGKDYFDPLDFLNLINWHYRFLTNNVGKPFDVLTQFNNLPLTDINKHLLIGFILKWFGGYPVNNLNTQFNSTLKLLESEYLEVIDRNTNKRQNIINQGLLGKNLSVEEEYELKDLENQASFLNEVDKVISNQELRQKLKILEVELNRSLKFKQSENEATTLNELFIFISHSCKDADLVKLFIDKILQLGLHINMEKVFCTSIQAATIGTGEDFRAVIKEKLMKSSHVIQIITSNYKESEVCLNEMGAAWVLNNTVIPFILSPITYTSVGFLHSPNQLLKLNDENDLLKFIDEMKIKDQNLLHSEVKRHVNDFLKSIRNLDV